MGLGPCIHCVSCLLDYLKSSSYSTLGDILQYFLLLCFKIQHFNLSVIIVKKIVVCKDFANYKDEALEIYLNIVYACSAVF